MIKRQTDDDTITACPECDSPGIEPRQPAKFPSTATSDAAWRCKHCTALFDEPVERPRRATSGLQGLAADLAAADPEEVSGDD